MGAFDDLTPEKKGAFGDLVPKEPGYAETGLRGMLSGTLGIYSGVGHGLRWAGELAGAKDVRYIAPGTDTSGMTAAEKIASTGKTLSTLAEEEIRSGVGEMKGPSFTGTFMENPSLKRAVGITGQAVPSLGLAVLTGGMASAGLRGLGMAAPAALRVGSAAAAGGLGLLEGAPQYTEAREAGKGVGEASLLGAASTVGTALLEYLPVSQILGVAGKGALKGAVTGMISEGVQEGTQQIWQNLVAKMGYDKSRSLAEGLVESIIGGAGAGGIVGGVVGRADYNQGIKDKVVEETLTNLMPEGSTIKVDGGMASVNMGERGFAVPADILSKALVAGVSPIELAEAHTDISGQVISYLDKQERLQQEAPAVEPAPVAEEVVKPVSQGPRLVAATPEALRYNIRGKEYAYTPKAGESMAEMTAKALSMKPAQAVAYLRKNAELVKTEEAKIGEVKTEEVKPEADFSLITDQEFYHGTKLEPTEFNIPSWFTTRPDLASIYANNKKYEGAQKVYPVRLGIENPLEMRFDEIKNLTPGQIRAFKMAGYDGAISTMDNEIVAVPFESAQVRSRFEQKPETPTEQTPAETSPEVSALRTYLGQSLKKDIAADAYQDAPVPESMRDVHTALEENLGRKIVYIKTKNAPIDFHGVTGILPDTIFINAETKKPHMAVLGHEFMHSLKAEDQEIFDDIFNTVKKMVPLKDMVTKSLFANFARKEAGLEPLPVEKVVEENVADFLGEQFTSKQFWVKVERQNPSGFATFVHKVLTFLNKIKSIFKGPQLSDIERAQDVAAAALARYMDKHGVSEQETLLKAVPEFSYIEDLGIAGVEKINQIAKAVKNSKSKFHQMAVQYAPQWLSVTPLQTIAHIFEKRIPQIKNISNLLGRLVTIRTDLIDNAFVMHDEATKLSKKGVGVKTFNKAAELGTFNRMNPWLPLEEQDWVPKEGTREERLIEAQRAWVASDMQKATGLTFNAAYIQAKNAFDALKTPKLQQTYKDMVEYLKDIRKRERNNLLGFIESVSDEGTLLREQLMARFNASFNELQGAYWPLSRYGDFTLEFIDPDGFRQVRPYNSINDREIAKRNLMEVGVDPATFKESRASVQPRSEVAIPQELMSQLQKAVQEKYLESVDRTNENSVQEALNRAQSTIEEMSQIWLRWLPETSALKSSIRRRNVKGYSEDMLRSFQDYVGNHASGIAWSEQGRKIENELQAMADNIKETMLGEEAVDTTLDQAILNDMRQRIQSLKTARVGSVASMLGKLASAYYMTSPSIALVQMSQLAVLTLPKVAVKYGAMKASKALYTGTKEAFSKNFTREAMYADPTVNSLYDMLRETITEETRQEGQRIGEPRYTKGQLLDAISKLTDYQKQLLALREAMARNLLDISATHEAYELTRGKNPQAPYRKAFHLAMSPMRLSELASRKAAVLSTYDLATQKGKDFFDALDDVAEVVDDTLYSYAKENKGWRLQGGIARVLLQFKHYPIMTGIRLAVLFKESIKSESVEVRTAAQKEFIGIMGMAGLLAGTVGLPMSRAIFAILDLILGSDDEPVDSELEFTNWLRDTLGDTAGEAVAHGVPTLMGMNLSRRIGLQDVYGSSQEAPPSLHGGGLAAWHAVHLLGPAYTVFEGWVKGYDQIVNKGNYLRGLEDATPKPIRDVLKAVRVASEGYETSTGKKLLADEQIGPDEIIALALGIYPDELAKAQAAESALRSMSTKISERRGKLIRQASRAILEGDDPEEAMQGIKEFNKKMPRFVISAGDVRSAVRTQLKGELGTTGVREQAVAQQYGIKTYTK